MTSKPWEMSWLKAATGAAQADQELVADGSEAGLVKRLRGEMVQERAAKRGPCGSGGGDENRSGRLKE